MNGRAGRDPFARYRELMAAEGFRPRRRLGQNFLLDPSLHRSLLHELEPGPDDLVLEVGAGLGFLTRELAAVTGRVLAVEIDPRLCRILEGEISGLAEAGKAVRLLCADALGPGGLSPRVEQALAEEAEGLVGRFLCISNLPYAVAGPLLAALAVREPPPAGAALMLQQELAERLVAAPGEAAYGSLSVLTQAAFEVRLARRVGREVFRPRPRVDSAIAVLRHRPGGLSRLDPADRVAFARFVRALFGARRKQLRKGLVLRAVGLGGEAAASALPPRYAHQRPGAVGWQGFLEIWGGVRGFV